MYRKAKLMRISTKIMLVGVLLFGTGFSSWADRGVGKKSKNRMEFNISTPTTLKNSMFFNLRTGLKYTGSLLIRQQDLLGNSVFSNTLITYQKGNTVYIIPYKHIVAVPEISSGYTGMKIIIHPH